MGLFGKKPGGTFFGNLVRGVGSAVSGGLLGKGWSRVEVGQTKTNRKLMKDAKAAAKVTGMSPVMVAPADNKTVNTVRNVVGSLSEAGSEISGGSGQTPWNPIEVGEDGKARLNMELPAVQANLGLANSPILWIGGGLLLLLILKKR